MFGRKKNHVPQKQIDSLIGASTTISGDIIFTGGLRVDGVVKGFIQIGRASCRERVCYPV